MKLYTMPGDRELGIRPAIILHTRRRQYMLRFGRDRFTLFSERYAGQYGIPRRYWYGPYGLTFRILNISALSTKETKP